MTFKIEQFPTKLFLKDIEFDKNTKWIDVERHFSQKSFFSNRPQGEVIVNYIDYTFFDDLYEVCVSVNFVDNQIEGASISIPQINDDYDHTDGMDFYRQRDKREQRYQRWLDYVLVMTSSKPDGSRILVGSDKSENTYIVISWWD